MDVIGTGEQAPGERRDAEDGEEVAAGVKPLDRLGLATLRQIESLVAERERSVEQVRAAPERVPDRVGPG